MSVVHYRLDLDKTYLATPFEDRVALLKVPFEAPAAKQTLPGMVSLVKALKDDPGIGVEGAEITILSASPTFMADRLRAKLELDGVAVDRFVFKDQWSLIRKARFKEIANPFAYKLHALCRLGREITAPDTEVLVGDDWDMDPLIYSVYAEQRDGRLPPEVLEGLMQRFPIGTDAEEEIRELMAEVRGKPSVDTVFIRREKRRRPEFYGAFGRRIRTYDDTFQLALMLYDQHRIDAAGVTAVVAELKARRWRNTAFSFSWRSLVHEQRLERYGEICDLLEALEVLPKRGLWRRLFGRIPEPAGPIGGQPDWDALTAYPYGGDEVTNA